eukprot:10838218-Alexandrium_andersonii.AAC.1
MAGRPHGGRSRCRSAALRRARTGGCRPPAPGHERPGPVAPRRACDVPTCRLGCLACRVPAHPGQCWRPAAPARGRRGRALLHH